MRSAIHKCVTCICWQYEGKPYHTPPLPPLSAFRVNEAPPFSYSDYAGPLFVHTQGVADSERLNCNFHIGKFLSFINATCMGL